MQNDPLRPLRIKTLRTLREPFDQHTSQHPMHNPMHKIKTKPRDKESFFFILQ